MHEIFSKKYVQPLLVGSFVGKSQSFLWKAGRILGEGLTQQNNQRLSWLSPSYVDIMRPLATSGYCWSIRVGFNPTGLRISWGGWGSWEVEGETPPAPQHPPLPRGGMTLS